MFFQFYQAVVCTEKSAAVVGWLIRLIWFSPTVKVKHCHMQNCADDNTYNRGETKNTVIDGGRHVLLIVIQDKKNKNTLERSTLADLTGSTLDLKTFGESWGRSSKFGTVGNTSQ